ncbi:MAG: NAD(+)/NADH kinase [Candidatus Cloacimonetes bacterium]|nr:NAD(+)/NADH kinase [Candidatus Cloacimonadota bacterium]
MTCFGLVLHPDFYQNKDILELLDALCHLYGIRFYHACPENSALPGYIEPYPFRSKKAPVLHCILVFGGDGTILRTKDFSLQTDAPILGINLGYLGFLSETTLSEISQSFQDLLNGKYKLLHRMLLNCQLRRNGKIVYQGLALNDAVVYKADTPRLIQVRIYHDNRYVFDCRCDGVIAATPTGSTAYSLSAGGPILSPQMKAIVISPLNPHNLTIRPMVFPAEGKLIMRIHGLTQPAWLQIDGVNCIQADPNDELIVSAAKPTVSFIKLSNRTFYKILRNKMHLGR